MVTTHFKSDTTCLTIVCGIHIIFVGSSLGSLHVQIAGMRIGGKGIEVDITLVVADVKAVHTLPYLIHQTRFVECT